MDNTQMFTFNPKSGANEDTWHMETMRSFCATLVECAKDYYV